MTKRLKSPLVMITVKTRGYLEIIRKQGPITKPVQCTYTEFVKMKKLGYAVETTEDPFVEVVEKKPATLETYHAGLTADPPEKDAEIFKNSIDTGHENKSDNPTVKEINEEIVKTTKPSPITIQPMTNEDEEVFEIVKKETTSTDAHVEDKTTKALREKLTPRKLTKKEKKAARKKKKASVGNPKYYKSVLLRDHNLSDLRSMAKMEKVSSEGTKSDIATRLSKLSK